MRIAILTAEEPLHLPRFFSRFFKRRARDVVGVFPCRLAYKNQTTFSVFRCYMKAFGVWNALRLAWRVASAKVKNILGIGRRAGRFYSVRSVARHYGLLVETPGDVNAPEFLARLRALGVDLILSVFCTQIFKADLINLPALGCLNVHGADLPKYRGIAPSFWMLAKGEAQAGVTIFFINAGIDTGDAAGKRFFPVLPDDTLESFLLRAKREACDLALETLERIETGTVERTPLEGEGSYFGFPTREAYREFRKRGRRLW